MDNRLEIDGVIFERIPGIKYDYNYPAYFDKCRALGFSDAEITAEMIKKSLFFVVYFVLKIPIANCKWWIDACWEVQNGPKTDTLDLWARFHGKSSVITAAETIQRICKDPEERICIFSWKISIALSFFRQIKGVFESSKVLKLAFPHIFWDEPSKEAYKWSENEGIWVKRKGTAKEPTLMAAGLVEGAPTGFHFTGRIYDDIMTDELSRSPDMIQTVKDAFDMSQNLKTGTYMDWQRVVGTPYNYSDVLMYISGLKTDDGTPVYYTRKKPATVDGTPNGESAYLPEEELTKLRANKRIFYSQQLLDPTPLGAQRLEASNLIEINPAEVPGKLFKFMAVDPAGMRLSDKRGGDSWAMVVAGVEPYRDDLGASRVFILDMIIEPMTETEALSNVVNMFLRNGHVRQIGIEKVGISTAEIHVAKALQARGRALTVENKGLVILRPAGRAKEQRIESGLAWPLLNSKLHISTAVPSAYRERLKLEMTKFPFWHDDALDAVSYIYDMIRDYRFGKQDLEPERQDRYSRPKRFETKDRGWLYV